MEIKIKYTEQKTEVRDIECPYYRYEDLCLDHAQRSEVYSRIDRKRTLTVSVEEDYRGRRCYEVVSDSSSFDASYKGSDYLLGLGMYVCTREQFETAFKEAIDAQLSLL